MNKTVQNIFEEKNLSDMPNSVLIKYMDILSNEFETTKLNIISMTHELDLIEDLYNKILKEYQKRV